jgi:hypothetical protein
MATKSIIANQAATILSVLKQFPEGASLEQIQAAAGLDIDVRQLQRRMSNLCELGTIQRRGKTRSIRYHLPVALNLEEEPETYQKVYFLTLSEAGEAIKEMVSLPEAQRIPVGYNQQFLQSYRPNVDFYLSVEDRKQLAKLGQTNAFSVQQAGTYAKQVLQRLLIDLSWNSSRLEGNTYSLLETERLIELGRAAEEKSATDTQMILNHKEAIEFIVQSADEIGYNRYTILNLHALLSYNLLIDPASSGRIRSKPVGIKRSVYTPLAMPPLIEAMFELILHKVSQIKDPFEQAFFMMVHLPYLQPFDDVNKRTSRLAMNIAFNRYNLSPLSFIDVPHKLYMQGLLGVYELNRVELLKDIFIWAYARSAMKYAAIQQTVGEPDPFRMKYRSEIKEAVKKIVTENHNRDNAINAIASKAQPLPVADQTQFIAVVETELLNLHDGNFARYWIKPSEYILWKEAWK